MHKQKDGKIIASLTEVKNKTGDIFALVDEFGEVTLTSYNKPKYKITKVDILETVKIDEGVSKKSKRLKKTPTKSKKSINNFEVWDRSNKEEKDFIEKALKSLQ